MLNLYKISKTALLILILIASYFIFTYNYFDGWWYSCIGTVLIVLISFFIFKSEFLKAAGLKFKLSAVPGISVFLLFAVFCSLTMIEYISRRNGITILSRADWSYAYHAVFYTMNEEIILGSIILYILIHRWKIHPLFSSVLLALCFSVLHFAVYKWIFSEKGILMPAALVTLFFAGILRNNLIIYAGHIGYSWALHFSWIIIMFGKSLRYSELWGEVSEPERFNIYLGPMEMVLISSVLAVLSSMYGILKNSAQREQ